MPAHILADPPEETRAYPRLPRTPAETEQDTKRWLADEAEKHRKDARMARRLGQMQRRNEQEPATTSSAPTSSGAAMASIEEVRGGIAQATDKASDSLGHLQQAHSDLEQSQGLLMRAVEGSSQADADEAVGLLGRAIGMAAELQQTVSAAVQSAEGVGARL